jgi:cytochrome P450
MRRGGGRVSGEGLVDAASDDLVFDPYDYAFQEDPYPLYSRLRAEAPLFHNEPDDLWVLSRHADVQDVLRDDTAFSNRMGVSLDPSAWNSEAHRVMSFLALDGEEQRRLRRLVSSAFTPRRVRDLEPSIRRLARMYLDRILEVNAAEGRVDWIAGLAGKLPMDVISEMMGVPGPDRDGLRALADRVVHREEGVRDVPAAGFEASFELISYYEKMVSERRRARHDDLTSALVEADVDGDRLEDHEIIAFLFLMVVAGNETTTKLLGNALFHLAASPEQKEAVFASPGDEDLLSRWIEETLRHDTSSQMLARLVSADVHIHGRAVPAGSKLVVLVGSANRDERVFTDPTRFDIHRDRSELSQILSFGFGRHFCLGANLARLEANVVLSELVARVPDFSVHAGEAERVHSTSVRGFASLPVTLAGTR